VTGTQAFAFDLSGRPQTGGDAALYGAPELMVGDYNSSVVNFDVDLNWDAEQALLLGGTTDLNQVEQALVDSLKRELANIAGE
jgi:hypothetical protein